MLFVTLPVLYIDVVEHTLFNVNHIIEVTSESKGKSKIYLTQGGSRMINLSLRDLMLKLNERGV